MTPLTQTSLHPAGNCWQTCVACILDLDPEVMPPQVDYDKKVVQPDGTVAETRDYHTVLNAYLREHHGLAYVDIYLPEETLSAIQVVEPGWHMISGRTVRSEAQNGLRHLVVARYGRVVWDPHPSRAGLIDELRWGLLIPFPQSWRKSGLCMQTCACPPCQRRAST